MDDPPIPVPRAALADLLLAAGSPLTPEEFAASLPRLSGFTKYPSRARAAVWSKGVLILVAVCSVLWVCTPIGFDIEDLIIAVALSVVTFFEFRVHRYFKERDPRAPILGFHNQSAFAGLILIYGLYHAFSAIQMPDQAQAMLEENNLTDTGTLRGLVQGFYLTVGVVGGISQFGLAWYYRSARDPQP